MSSLSEELAETTITTNNTASEDHLMTGVGRDDTTDQDHAVTEDFITDANDDMAEEDVMDGVEEHGSASASGASQSTSRKRPAGPQPPFPPCADCGKPHRPDNCKLGRECEHCGDVHKDKECPKQKKKTLKAGAALMHELQGMGADAELLQACAAGTLQFYNNLGKRSASTPASSHGRVQKKSKASVGAGKDQEKAKEMKKKSQEAEKSQKKQAQEKEKTQQKKPQEKEPDQEKEKPKEKERRPDQT